MDGPGGQQGECAVLVAAVRSGDQGVFADLVQRYRRPLQVHCHRMVGSAEEAEDLVQETFLRAWRSRGTLTGRATVRAWLYRIATNACLDALAERGASRRPTPVGHPGLALREHAAPRDAEPDAALLAKETLELAFLAAIQHLPPRQRAILIFRDVLGWPAKETADLLDTTTASVKSALQRARPAIAPHLPPHRHTWTTSHPTTEQRALLQRYMHAHENQDPTTLAELVSASPVAAAG